MDKVKDSIAVYSVFDKPGDFEEILKKEYEVIIQNDLVFNSPIEIIIPTYKRPLLLLEAINSAINQDVKINYLITIIDNDPDSLNEKILKNSKFKDKIRYIRNKENLGLFGNWNRAIQICNASYFALLHDDDLLSSNYLSKMIKAIKLFPDGAVFSNLPHEIIDGKVVRRNNIGNMIRHNTIEKIAWESYIMGNQTNACAMLINKSSAIKLKGWSSSEFPSGDYLFNARAAFNFSVYKVHLPLSLYRWYQNESLSESTNQLFYFVDINFVYLSLQKHYQEVNIHRFFAYYSVYLKIKMLKVEYFKKLSSSIVENGMISKFLKTDSLRNLIMKFSYRIYVLFQLWKNWIKNSIRLYN